MNSHPNQTVPTAGSSRLKVALCYSGCHRLGGVERVVFEAARYLSAGCSPTVVASALPLPNELPSTVETLPVPGRSLPLGFGLPRIRKETTRLLTSRSFDVVAGFGVQAPRDSVVWIQSVHATWWEQSHQRRRGWDRLRQKLNPFHRIVLSMEAELLRNRGYRRLIALTSSVADDLQRFYQVPPSDVVVLPNGFHPTEFNTGLREAWRRNVRKRLGIPEAAWTLLFVANEWERKGLVPLMEAVSQIRDSSVHLVAVGKLPASMLRGMASKLGIASQVHFTGPSENVNAFFGAADAFVLPTIYEAWGMVIVEAMACGLPVLTSRCAGASVAVHQGENGFLLDDPFSVADIRSGLLQLRSQNLDGPAAISSSVAPYRWERIFKQYEEVLRGAA